MTSFLHIWQLHTCGTTSPFSGEVQVGVKHRFTRCGDYRIGFGMYGTAKLIAFAAGYPHMLALAKAHVAAVFSAAWRSVIARRNDYVIFNDDTAEFAAQACAALCDGLGNVKIIIGLAYPFHMCSALKIKDFPPVLLCML